MEDWLQWTLIGVGSLLVLFAIYYFMFRSGKNSNSGSNVYDMDDDAVQKANMEMITSGDL